MDEYIEQLREAINRSLGLPATFFVQEGDLAFVTKIRQEIRYQKYVQMIRVGYQRDSHR